MQLTKLYIYVYYKIAKTFSETNHTGDLKVNFFALYQKRFR